MKKVLLSFYGLLMALGMQAQSPVALTLEDFDIQQGETKKVYVSMQNEGYDIISIEYKMQLPEGLSLKGRPTLVPTRIGSGLDDFGETVASGKTVNAAKNAVGYWVFSIFSMTDQWPFSGTAGNVIEMSVAADADMPLGETSIRLYDIELSTKESPYYPANYTNKVNITSSATAIRTILKECGSADVYTPSGLLVGRQMTESELLRLPKGVYLVNNQKVVVK